MSEEKSSRFCSGDPFFSPILSGAEKLIPVIDFVLTEKLSRQIKVDRS
jgi:hypothetical protein